MKAKTKKILKIAIPAGVALLLAVCMIVMYLVAVSIYDGSFNYRCETSEEDAFALTDFPALSRERHTFTTYQGHTLVGYLYASATEQTKGVIVFAHGMGAGGQQGYLDIFDILVRGGYAVFAYDATANDESEGDVLGGLPQGYIDLDYAISYVKALPAAADLPILLMGYSWGGLSVANVLNYHPDVAAVVSLAGWNKSMNLIDYRGQQMVGILAKALLPFATVHELEMYGKYAFSTGVRGFENSDCEVMIVHGALDDTIPTKYGYDLYEKKFGEEDRFTFKYYEDRDHDVLHVEEDVLDVALIVECVAFFDAAIGK